MSGASDARKRSRVPPGAKSLLLALAAALLLPAGAAGAWWLRPPVRDDEHSFAQPVYSWQELRRRNVVMQEREYSCGAAALATLIRYYWRDDVGEEDFLAQLDQMLTPEEAADRIRNGLTMTDLRRAAVRAGSQASMGQVSFEQLAQSKVPLIVGIQVREFDHFVVYRGASGQYVYLADPARGNVRTPIAEFLQQWQNNAVLAVVKPDAEIRETSPLSVRRGETLVGQMNEPLVRKNFLSVPVFFPPPALP